MDRGDVSGQGRGRAWNPCNSDPQNLGFQPQMVLDLRLHPVEAQDLGMKAGLVLCPHGAGDNTSHMNNLMNKCVQRV